MVKKPKNNVFEEFMQKKTEEIADLKAQTVAITSERDELVGKNKQMYGENVNIRADLQSNIKEKDEIKRKLHELEAQKMQFEKKQEELITKLHHSTEALHEEKLRVRKEDEEKKAAQKEDYDRMWAEHEQEVVKT